MTQKRFPQGSQGPKVRRFVSDLSVSGWQLQLEFMDDYEMTHMASLSIEEVLYCFLGHLSNLKFTRAKYRFGSDLSINYKARRSYQIPKICLVLNWYILQGYLRFYNCICRGLNNYLLYVNTHFGNLSLDDSFVCKFRIAENDYFCFCSCLHIWTHRSGDYWAG